MRYAVFAAVLVAGALGLAGGQPREARACSFAALHPQIAVQLVEEGPVAAVGTFSDAGFSTIVLEVEEYLQGALPDRELVVNNRSIRVSSLCGLSIAPDSPGFALPEGERVLAILEPDDLGVGADWRLRSGGRLYLPLDGEHPIVFSGPVPPPSLAEVRDAAAAMAPTFQAQALEPKAPPCYAPRLTAENLPSYLAGSESVVVGRFGAGGGNTIVLEVDEVLRGTVTPGPLSVNNRRMEIDDFESCTYSLRDRRQFEPGHPVVAFLVPDTTGVADWRPAAWGWAVFAIVDGELQDWPGMPTLSMLRSTADERGWSSGRPDEVQADSPPPDPVEDGRPEPPAQAEPGERGADSSGRWLVAAAVAGVVVLVAATAAVARRRQKPNP